MTKDHLPVHPVTGVRALFVGKRGPVWPVMGAAPDHEFEMPETLEGLSVSELDSLKAQATQAFKTRYAEVTKDGRTPTDEELAELEGLDGAVDTIEAAAAEVQAEEDARTAKAENLRAKLMGDDSDDTDGDDAAADTADTAEGDDADAGSGDADSTEQVATDITDDEEQEQPQSVAASAGRRRGSFTGLARGKGNADKVPAQNRLDGFLMSQSVPKPKTGFVTSADVAGAFERTQSGHLVRSLKQERHGEAKTAVSLATLPRQIPTSLMGRDQESLTAAIELATDESKLKSDQGQGSLLAAGGWCAPSERIYDFLGIPDAGDLLDLPEVGIERGGIMFPVQPDFGMAFQSPGFLFTEAEAIAQTEDKPCFRVPCVGFDEVRLDAIGLCITAGLLQQKGYPEAVKLYIDGILQAHQHRISSYSIQKLVAGSIPVEIPAAYTMGAAGALLNSVELAIEDVRTRNRIPQSQTLEVVTTTWARPAMRADLAYRRGLPFEAVTDAQLDAALAERGAKVQYVSDWQTGAAGQPGAPTGTNGATAITKFPDTIKFLVYPSGTWFRSLTDVIEVGNLYDQAQLKQNEFTALFTEDGIAVGKRGIESRVYTVHLDYNGAVGAAETLAGPVSGGQ